MKTHFFLLLSYSLFFFACKKDEPTSQTTDQTTQTAPVISTTSSSLTPYSIKADSLIKEGGGPCKTDSDCMHVAIHWPVLNGGSDKVRNAINTAIDQSIRDLLDYETDNNPSTKSLDQIADQLIADYKTEYEESQSFGMAWANEVKSEIVLLDNVAAFKIFNYTFSGGAHPNTYTRYLNFDLGTGKEIGFTDFIKDTTALKPVLVQLFEQDMKDKTGEAISIDDFFWGNGFKFPKNFTLQKDHIEFFYNPYEAAAYAYGPISLSLPYTDLKEIVDLSLLKKQ